MAKVEPGAGQVAPGPVLFIPLLTGRKPACELPTLSLEDALGQLVYLYAERGSPKYEKAALRWLERYLTASTHPRLRHSRRSSRTRRAGAGALTTGCSVVAPARRHASDAASAQDTRPAISSASATGHRRGVCLEAAA